MKAISGPTSRICTVYFLELVDKFKPAKKHVNRIPIIMILEYFDLNNYYVVTLNQNSFILLKMCLDPVLSVLINIQSKIVN